nr:gas vesicle synthesis family protein [uncultured bacterium]
MIRRGLEQFVALTSSQAEQVTGVRPSENGWSILVDVVELERVPATASVMATYRVDLNSEGALLSYERLRRYTRSSTD